MSIRFQADNDLRLDDLDDGVVLRLAASQSASSCKPRQADDAASAGVVLVIPQNAPVRDVVETLILIWADDRANDWTNLTTKIPF